MIEAVGISEHGSRVGAAGIEAGHGAQLGVENLHILINLDAAQGAVAGGEVTSYIVGSLQQGLEELCGLGELPVVAGLGTVAHCVVVLDGLLQVLQVHAGLLSDLLDGLALEEVVLLCVGAIGNLLVITGEDRVVAGRLSTGEVQLLLTLPVVQVGDAVMIGDIIETILLVVIYDGGVDDGNAHVLLLEQQGVAGVGGVVHDGLVDETLAVQVHHQVGLTHGLGQGLEHVGGAGGIVGNLHVDIGLLCAQSPEHVHAVAVQAGNPEGEHINAPLPAHVLLDHVHIVADAAGGDNHGIGQALDLLAVLAHCDDAPGLTLRANQQLLHRGVQVELHADLPGILGNGLDHNGSAALGGLVGAGELDHVLGSLGVLEVLEYAQEFNTLVLHPLYGFAGHIEPTANQLGVGTPVGILHEEVKRLVLGVVVGHGLLLELGLNGKESHAHVGCAADGAGLLKNNNGAAAGGVQGLLCLGCSAEAGHAAANEYNIGFNMFHRVILLSFSDVLLL